MSEPKIKESLEHKYSPGSCPLPHIITIKGANFALMVGDLIHVNSWRYKVLSVYLNDLVLERFD